MSQENPYESSAYAPAAVPTPPRGPTSGMAVAALVLGILTDVSGTIGFCCCPYVFAPLGMIMGVIGLIFGYMGLKECQDGGKAGYGMALAGMICSGIGIVIALIGVLVVVGVIAFAAVQPNPNANF